jgi:plastocyanin
VRKVRIMVVFALVALAIGAVASVALAATERVSVRRSGTSFRFNPSSLTIQRGDTVRWSWSGSVPHNVRSQGRTSRTAARLTYSQRFTRRGSFRVVCTVHAATQRMTVRVR